MPPSGWLHDSAWKDATHPMQLFGRSGHASAGFMNMTLPPNSLWHRHLVIHEYAAGCVARGLFALHVGGALKHQCGMDKEKSCSVVLSP
jgi:hypothetical protein